MEQLDNISIGSLSSAPDGRIVEKILLYVHSVLQEFEGKIDDNENYLTNELCLQLGFRKPAEFPFFFQHQNIEDSKQNTSTDFAVFGTYAYSQAMNQQGQFRPLISFEAKRLNDTLPNNRKKEYVVGEYAGSRRIRNSGGIERFKNLRHGKDVNHASIIGYTQTDSFSYWFEKINTWISNEIGEPHDPTLTWDSDDYLTNSVLNRRLYHCVSKPKRKSGYQLKMHHVWINLME